MAYKLNTNENNKATELVLWRVNGRVNENPHMRAFWGSTISFFLAFLGWFSLAPLNVDVAKSLEICENQLYPPNEFRTRKAFLKYEDIKTKETYCQYGRDDKDSPTDCNEVPTSIMDAPTCEDAATPDCVNAIEKEKYLPGVLAKCVCTGGTECRETLTYGNILSVGSTILVRVALGTVLERLGPVNTQSCLLLFGAIWVAAAALINDKWNYLLIRTFIGAVGATFVTNQFWCSFMFAPNVVGTVNATAAGWGNLGGGVTQIFMVLVLFEPFKAAGMSADAAWRTSMLVPALMFIICAIGLKTLCWDTPTSQRMQPADVGKTKGASLWDYVVVLRSPTVLLLIFQYSACFGTELAMNNLLATHFRSYFQMKAADAAALASSFGLMNLFARSLGGMASDAMYARFGMGGRIWVQFITLVGEGLFLLAFGFVSNDQEWYTALGVLIVFSLFVQAAEGSTYGIVPFTMREHLAIVSAVVGAGGNLGAVIANFAFYNPIEDDLLPFRLHACYVLLWGLLTPFLFWSGLDDSQRSPDKIEGKGKAELADEPVVPKDSVNVTV